jgi:hypothetical protein
MANSSTPKVLACSTDKYPERVPTIEIGTSDRAAERVVVMSLGPGPDSYSSMPHLAGGDEIWVSAELEVTTDHPLNDPTYCVSQPYEFSPHIHASLLLANGEDVTEDDGENGIRIGGTKAETCTQDEHHCLVVFEPTSYPVPDEGLPWQGQSYLNLVLRAHNHEASSGDVLLIGQNEPADKGSPAHAKGDEGKINVVRYRGLPQPTGKTKRARSLRNSHVPIKKHPAEPRVIYSMRLVDLKKDEQLLMKADFQTRDPYRYRARVSTEVIVADTPDETDRDNPARDYVPFHGELGKGNGTNVLPKESHRTQKFGTLRILEDAPQPLFVNVVVTSAAPASAIPKPNDPHPKANDAVRILRGGSLEITRLQPRCAG